MRYAFAAIATVAAFLLRVGLARYLGPPYILFYPTVLLAALLGGLGPGILATALSAALAAFWILPAERQLPQMSLRESVSLAAFVVIGLLMSTVAHLYRQARDRVAQNERDLLSREALESARRREEEALRRYETLFDKAPFAIALTKMPEGTTVSVNAAFLGLFEYARDEVVGKTSVDLGISDAGARAEVAAELQRLGSVRDFECTRTTRSGAQRALSLSADRIVMGGQDFVLTSVQDITARRRAEAALRESEARLNTIVENISEGVAVSGLDGQLLHFNRAALDLHGFSTLEECRRHLLQFADLFELSDLDGTVLAVSQWPLSRVLRGESLRDVEVRVRRKQPAWQRTYSYGGTLVRDADGQPMMGVVTMRDVTERRRAEEELREKNDELVRFTYTVSHDLKSPLVTVRTFLGYLERDFGKGDEATLREDFGHIRTAADRMSRLLDELLELSRVGRKVNPTVQVPLQLVVGEALDLVAGRLSQRGVKVEVTREPVVLEGDRPRLVEVFQNLLDNSAKFMGDQVAPRIEVGVEMSGGEPVLFVRDNGIGIDPRHQQKLFGLFEKLEPGSDGTGIGLAQVRRIVQVHGGRIWAESEGRGHGTCFRFTLAGTSWERSQEASA